MIIKTHSLLPFACLVLLATQLSSCFVEGSFEDTNERNEFSNNSPGINKEDFGLNIGGFLTTGLGTLDVSKNNSVDWLDPQPPPSPDNGFLFAVTGEFSQKGSKTPGIVTTRLNYLEIHPDVLYAHRFSDDGLIFGGLGPYLAYGIGGKTGSGVNEEASFGGANGYRRFDWGLNLQAGYRLSNSLQFSLGYDLGIYDKSNDPADYSSRNRSFSVNVAYSVSKIVAAFKRN